MRYLAAVFLIFIIAATPRTCIATDAQDSRDLEDHIWELENVYVTAYKNADHPTILALMHEGFLGWPDSEDMPTACSQVQDFLEEKYGTPGTWSFQIDRSGIRIFDDVVITHYVLIVSVIDAADSSQARKTRITHTWIKEDEGWKIVGGMSNIR